jgi:hypothetical protein
MRLLVVMLLLAFGCGRGATNCGSISGEVTLDGKPIEKGSILFMPSDGVKGTIAGGPILNGRYHIDAVKGPAVGLNRVEIRSMKKTGRRIPKGMGQTGEMIDEEMEAVAMQFNSASTLKAEIKSGENTENFAVRSQ